MLVLSLFLLVLIEGVHFGGFYVLYLFFGLTYAAPFALIALTGIAVMVSVFNSSFKKRPLLKPFLYLIGWIMLIISYVIFFTDNNNNHRETRETTVPIISFVLFGICSLCFLFNMFSWFVNKTGKKRENVRTV